MTPEILNEAKGRRREIPFETIRGENTPKVADKAFMKPNPIDSVRRKKPCANQGKVSEQNSNSTIQTPNEDEETGRAEIRNPKKQDEADEDALLEAELVRDSDTEQNASHSNNSDSLFEDCDKMEE